MKSRTYNSLKNISISMIEQIVSTILIFVTRTVFIHVLGETYLGLNGLFCNILSLLSLSDLGVGTAILYSMYKPKANEDYAKVLALLGMYKKIYCCVGIAMTFFGLAIMPFLGWFVSDVQDISLKFLAIIYFLYLINTTITYFFSYKKSILIIEQDNHIISISQLFICIIQNISQIAILLVLKSFLFYLVLQIGCTLLNNIWISNYVNRHYEYLKKNPCVLDKNTLLELKHNILAMFLSKVSSVVVTSTDNLLISKFVSTIILGYYSNYVLIINMLRMIFTKIFEALAGSIGNAVALKSKKEIRKVFKQIFFANYWLISMTTICLYILLNPFIDLWIGSSYLLNQSIVFLLCLNFYMRFIRNTQLAFIDAFGLYWEIRWKSIVETIINLIVSLILLVNFRLGIQGVLLGTFVSNLFTNFWYEPYLIYVYQFEINVKEYFVEFGIYIIHTLCVGTIVYFLSQSTPYFFMKTLICLFVINAIYIILYGKNEMFIQYKKILYELLKKIK